MATFGNSTLTGSTSFSTSLNATRFQAPENGNITKMTAYVGTFGSTVYGCAIYADSSGAPGAKLATGGTNHFSGSGGFTWKDCTISLSITNGTWYWLCLWASDANVQFAYDTTAAVASQWQSVDPTYETYPDPFGTPSFTFTRQVAIYATYTASGGAGVTYPQREGGTRGLNRGLMTGLRRAFVRKDHLFVPAYNPRGALKAAA